MAIAFNGSSQYLEYAGTVRTSAPLSMAAFQYVSGATTNARAFNQYNSTGNNMLGVDSPNDANYGERAAWYADGYSTPAERYRGSDASNGYHGTVGAWSAFTNAPSLHVDGGAISGTSTAGSGGTFAANTTGIGTLVYGATRYYGNGRSAECAVWSVQLSAQSMAAVSFGFCPLLVEPSSLIAYWPLGGALGDNYRDAVGQRDMTATGSPAFAEHPRIIYPCNCQAC